MTAKLLKMDLINAERERTHVMLMMGQSKIESLILKNTCPVQSLMALRSRDVKLKMMVITSLV